MTFDTDRALAEAAWRKSSHSGSAGGQCVEYTRDLLPAGLIAVRDSKDPAGPALRFSPAAWTAFVHAVAAGRLAAS